MSDFALNYGQRFAVGDVEFEVVSTAINEQSGETIFEVLTVADAERRRERNRPELDEIPPTEKVVEADIEVAPAPEPIVASADRTMLVN